MDMDSEISSPETAASDKIPLLPLKTELLTRGRVIVAGLGGIGSILAPNLTLFLASLRRLPIRIQLIDGDKYEERNRERMEVPAFENKAVALCRQLTEKFGRPKLYIRPVAQYVNVENASDLIQEHDVVFACFDRHSSRKVLSDRCAELENIILISGGNDGVEEGWRGTYGNIQIFRRHVGAELNPPLTRFHPEIQKPADQVPVESCADLAGSSAPQILFANLAAACAMCCAFYRILSDEGKERIFDEICFDIYEGRFVPQVF
ncbi:MAG: ThiF family adenylyltransferase [Planctomycetes bacterium]|nr:ThiF family adenylyltransferase [Planctomycetota bacterium]